MKETDRNRQIDDRRAAVSEAFHSFHQPLTALHCGLELALKKPRTEGEYRKRIEDALVSAGAILRLNKALRELVDANDQGERFGTVAIAPVVAQLAEEISLIADAQLIKMRFGHVDEVQVSADPMKLLCTLGNVLSFLICELEPNGGVDLKATCEKGMLKFEIVSKGQKHVTVEPLSIDGKLREIRLDAARCYVWTLGGEFTRTDNAIEIKLKLKTD